MELDTFIRSLVRRWYIPVLLLGLAVLGVWTYHSYTEVKTATATVVVLTSSPAPGEFVPAQFGFDAIDESSLLAERVAARLDDGTTAAELEGRIEVSLRIDPSQRSTTPMYIVSGKDADADRAILIANLATEEGKQLYGELNSFDREDVRLAFQEELDRAEADVRDARMDLVAFMTGNDAFALPTRASQQLALVSQLRLASLTGFQSALAAEEAELERLLSLGPEYSRLTLALDNAEESQFGLEREVLSIVAGQTLAAEAQVKIFDSAEIQSNVFWKMLTYALAFTLAILLSLSIVYLYAQFERLPPTIEELEETFGLTVTTQVPNNTA